MNIVDAREANPRSDREGERNRGLHRPRAVRQSLQEHPRTATLESLGHPVVNFPLRIHLKRQALRQPRACTGRNPDAPDLRLLHRGGSAQVTGDAWLSCRPKAGGRKRGRLTGPPEGQGLRRGNPGGQGVHVPDVSGLLPPRVRHAPPEGHKVIRRGDKLKLNTRVDYLRSSSGVVYLTKQDDQLLAITETLDYSLWANVISRAEVRWDHCLTSDRPFGGGAGTSAGDKNALTVALNLIYKF